MSRRFKLNQNAEVHYDADRAFPVKVNYSNLQHHGSASNYAMNLNELIALRGQIPVKRGVYTTQGLNQFNLTQSGGIRQSGSGIIDDARNYGRRGVKFLRNKGADALEYAGDAGIDYAANYGKNKVRDVSKRVRGNGFFRSLAGNAAIGIGNLVGNTIKGGSARPANFGPRRRPIKSLVYSPEQEMAIASAQAGSGFLRNLAGNAAIGIGKLVGNTIKGGKLPKRKRKSNRGKGLVAPGMVR